MASKDRIIGRWEERVRNEIPAAAREPHLILVNTLPVILDNLEHSGRFVLSVPEPVPGHVDPHALRRAVENLAINAVKYGAASLPITVSVSCAHGRALLAVHNHGAHISVEQQATLFHAFQRLREAEQSDKRGWGLGLAQVRAVAEAHGGSIGVDSMPDRGTTFTIDIPTDGRPFQPGPTMAPSAG